MYWIAASVLFAKGGCAHKQVVDTRSHIVLGSYMSLLDTALPLEANRAIDR